MSSSARHSVGRLTRAGTDLLARLLAGETVTEAAKSAGLSRSAAYRLWRKDDFQAALTAARSELLESTIDRLRTKARDAVDVLAEVSGDAEPPKTAMSRVSASRETLAMMFRGVELHEIELRLKKLEALAEEGQK
jgi:hypothetical protein